MYKKSFLSLSFSSKMLQAVQLNGSKTAVSKFASVEIPQGLIVNHRVADVAKLGDFIKGFLKTHHFYERSVGIVVPEFSTFTKTMKLPALEAHELDEAIRWQSQEFLPIPIDNIVLDWKVITRTEHETEVLVVAIPQEVLSGYVESINMAGLYPLLVETPSLSLTRLGKQTDTRMILYGFLGEVVLIVTKGEKIVGTVVSSSADSQSILQTAMSMRSRFGELDLKGLEVAGTEISQEVYTKLSEALKLSAQWLTVSVEGMLPNQIQEYLVPLSTQLKEAHEPSDDASINLLPPKWVSQYEQKRWRVQMSSLMFLTTFVLGATLAASIAVTIMMTTQIASYKRLESQTNGISSEEEAEIKRINEATDRVVKISNAYFLPQTVVNGISSALPAGVRLTDYVLDFEQGFTAVKGIAATRTDIVTFKQKLEENEDFTNITIPISSLEAEQNVEFELSFLYEPAVPTKKNQARKLKTN